MATDATFPEEECFNVYWKVKNVSYCGYDTRSSEFRICYDSCCLLLCLGPRDVECSLESTTILPLSSATAQISFLTCDGSPEETISGNVNDTVLKVPREVIFGKRRDAFLPKDTLTVRLRYLTETVRGNLFMDSSIGVKRKYLVWTFKDFNEHYTNISKKVEVEKSEDYGDISLFFKSMDENKPNEQFNIEIYREGGERCYCVLKIPLLEVDGRARYGMREEIILEKSDKQQSRALPFIIKKKKLLEYENLLLPKDTLSLKCEFSASLGKVTEETTLATYFNDIRPLSKEFEDLSSAFKGQMQCSCVADLQTDLKSLLNNGELCDVSIQIGTDTIQAHKTILSARSPVFKAMFSKGLKEGTTGIVVIEDLDLETVRGLLLYMYTDSIRDKQLESVKNLYVAADKYEVLTLRSKCASLFESSLSITNVCELLLLADWHQDEKLKKSVIDFISEQDSEVFALQEWKDIEKNNSSLAFQTLRDICCNNRFICS